VKSNFDLNFFKCNVDVFGVTLPVSLSITSELCEFVRKAAGICSYIIVLFMFSLVLAEHDISGRAATYFTYDNWKSRFTIKFLCAVQLCLMLLYVFFWYMLRGELVFKKYLKELDKEN
jgi:hypothetical protein